MIDEKELVGQIVDEVYKVLQNKKEDTNATHKCVVIDDKSLPHLQDLVQDCKIELYKASLTSCDILILLVFLLKRHY